MSIFKSDLAYPDVSEYLDVQLKLILLQPPPKYEQFSCVYEIETFPGKLKNREIAVIIMNTNQFYRGPILFLYNLSGWCDNIQAIQTMKMVFIHSKHQHIWFHVFLFCVKPYTLSHYAFEKKVKKNFSKKKNFFLEFFFQKLPNGGQMKINDL